jgi:AAA family ATP:ADP antiporter
MMGQNTVGNQGAGATGLRDRALAALSIRPGEGMVTLLSALTIFSWFLGWGMMRPLRDAMGVAKGADYVMWLIIATACVSLVVSPVIAWGIGKLGSDSAGRRRVPVLAYRFFAVNLLLFAAAKWLTPEPQRYIVGYVFFVWSSVANMAAVSVFWGLASDVFPRERSLRLYGLIALGATLGLYGGGHVAKWMGEKKFEAWVFMVALAVMLEVVARLARAFGAAGARAAVVWERERATASLRSEAVAGDGQEHDFARKQSRGTSVDAAGGAGGSGGSHGHDPKTDQARGTANVLSGMAAVVKSPYLLGASAYLLIYTITSSLFYLVQLRVVNDWVVTSFADAAMSGLVEPLGSTHVALVRLTEAIKDAQATRTASIATIDLWAVRATLIVQLLLTGRILRWVGQGPALVATPLVTIAGLAWMGSNPGLQALTPVIVARRSIHFAVDRPSREALYTVIPPEQKYTAKSFIDTFIYRGGDVLGALIESGLKSSNTPMLWFAGPICVVGAVLGMWLGGAAKRKATGDASRPERP